MRTVYRLFGASAAIALGMVACTNDYDDFEFSDTGGAGGSTSGGAGGSTTGGSGGSGGGNGGSGGAVSGGGSGGAVTGGGGAGGTPTGGGGAGGTPTGGGGAGGTPIGGGGTTGCTGNNKLCNGACVATNDPKFGCGPTACDPCTLPNATTQCVSDKCALQTCTGGYDSCDANAANGCEQKLDTTDHCGACSRKCNTLNSTAATCAASACSHTCQSGFGDCSKPTTGPDNGCETNLATAKAHCGTCENNCGSQGASGGFACKNSVCGCSENSQCLTTGGLSNSSCNTGSGLCVCDGSTCNVGEACGKKSGNTVCLCNGGDACTAGQSCCPGAGCVDTQTDAKHCGGCNIACPTGKSCKTGACQ